MLSETSLRLTKQRQIILESLRSVTSHPTADEVYEMIRKRMPNISLGTVYRNLEILSDKGVIQKLDVGGSKKRFDGKVETHSHLRCTECGRVDDVDFQADHSLEEKVAALTEYKIIKHSLQFIGVCPACCSQ